MEQPPTSTSTDAGLIGERPWGDERPRTRGECIGRPRPCPWVSCKYHLLASVGEKGSLELSLDDGGSRKISPRSSYGSAAAIGMVDRAVERLDEMPETCALDVADGGALILEEVGDILGVTRERVWQLEAAALVRLRGIKRRHFEDPVERIDPWDSI